MDFSNSTNISHVIAKTANQVVDYLMPPIFCLDPAGDFARGLKKEFSWLETLESIEDVSNVPVGEILILKGGKDVLSRWVRVADKPNRTLIVIQEESFSNDKWDVTHSMSVRLIAPSTEKVLFHIKALLVCQDSMFFYDSEHPIYSLTEEFRSGLVDLAAGIYERQTIIAAVPDIDSSTSWYRFLFDDIPTRVKPVPITEAGMEPSAGSYLFIGSNDIELVKAYRADYQIILFTSEPAAFAEVLEDAVTLDLSPPADSKSDLFIKYYLASISCSFHLGFVPYYTDFGKGLTLVELKKAILESSDNDNSVPDALSGFIASSNRLSLPNILSDLELTILKTLKAKTKKVKGFSTASGIVLGTLHKKLRRLEEQRQKQS